MLYRFSLLALTLVTVVIVSVSGAGAAAGTNEFPSQFLGKWAVGKSENFDEYLVAKGYSWFTRALVKAASITKTFAKGTEPNRYNVNIDTTTKSVKWINIPFNKEFTGEYVDGAQHKVKFYYKDNTLFENHVPVDDSGEAKPELYSYKTDGSDAIIMYMTADGITAKRWYNKVK